MFRLASDTWKGISMSLKNFISDFSDTADWFAITPEPTQIKFPPRLIQRHAEVSGRCLLLHQPTVDAGAIEGEIAVTPVNSSR